MKRICVTGAGGFIGSHLVTRLKARGDYVIGADLKYPEFSKTEADEFHILDLREVCEDLGQLMDGTDEVYALAADMGGIGYISCHHSEILRNNLLINLHTTEEAARYQVRRYLFSSSACVYPEHLQTTTDVRGLRETDAYPAQPQDAYGWEKLTTERLLGHLWQEGKLVIRIARFHNIFGPLGTWQGGREKAPAALCRKIAEAKLVGRKEIEIWGDGQQTRSFCYIDDCLDGLVRLMESDYPEPLNIGQDRMVSIDELAYMISRAAEWPQDDVIGLKHVPGPEGVRGRNSDNTLALQTLGGWRPKVSLEEGLARTYRWIENQVLRVPCQKL